MIQFFAMAILRAGLLLFVTILSVQAQTNFILHTFAPNKLSGGVNGFNTNYDGVNPSGWLVLAGGTMFGTAVNGGTNGCGTLFAINTNGNFNLLYTFRTDVVGVGNTFGANPNGGLVLSNVTLYGTTSAGGSADQGVIFSINTNGTGIQNLHNFSDIDSGTNPDGANPSAGLIVSGAMLFGTTPDGGTGGNGVVFSCNINNKNFVPLHTFTVGHTNNFGVITNNDGANPACRLVRSGAILYGTTSAGGTNGLGTIFAINTNGTGFTVLHHFNTDGANPDTGLIVSSGLLYGMGDSIAFALTTNGAGFTILKQFDNPVDSATFAVSGLTISNSTIYGVAASGGNFGYGQIFSLNTNSANFSDFHDFTQPINYPLPATNGDGTFPNGGLILLNNSLYGTASSGGPNGSGVLFRASPPPSVLSSKISTNNLLLGFQTLAGINYIVQQNTNLAGGNWIDLTNFIGTGAATQFTFPTTVAGKLFFRVLQP